MKIRRLNSLFMILVGALLWQPSPAAADNYDPPARVARLSYSRGSVSFQPAGDSEWVDAILNLPIFTGDNLWAGEDSRAEVHMGSTAIRLDRDTGISFLTIGDHRIQIRLMQGSLIVHLRHLGNETFEVDTPNLAFSLQSAGEYRIDVNQEGTETAITTLQGEGEATGPWEPHPILSGQQVRFSESSAMDVDAGEISSTDEFADWAAERDHREDDVQSANYVSREMTGYEDLDEYGEWSSVTGYGVVWVPVVVPAGWVPYRFGHWVWVEPWGWTWVDDSPWGFAPFHYGRWAWVDGHWCWVPGPIVSQPVYAPALVVFLWGPGVSWLPLAPGEVFIPQYRTSPGYVHSVNTSNTMVSLATVDKVHSRYRTGTPANHITYVNQQVTNAVTAVSHDVFVNGRPVARSVMNVPQKRTEPAGALPTVPAPGRNRIAGQGTPARSVPPAAIFNRPRVTRRPSAAVAPPGGKTVSRRTGPVSRQPRPIADQAPTGKSHPWRNPARSHAPDLSTSTPPSSAKRKVEPQAPPPVPSRARPTAKPAPEVQP
jgi:hypothetical protein